MGKDIPNAQTAFWQIRPDELVFKQDIKNAMELPVDFRVELNAQDLFAVLHHVDGTILRPSGDGKPGRNRPRNGDERPTFLHAEFFKDRCQNLFYRAFL